MRQTLAFLALALACGPLPPPAPPPEGKPELCAAACSRMRSLGCEEGEPTPAGSTCEEWCENVERSGTVSLGPACLAAIQSCGEINACSR